MDLEEYNFCNEATYYSLLPEEEINYTEPASDVSSESDNDSDEKGEDSSEDGDKEDDGKLWTKFMTDFYSIREPQDNDEVEEVDDNFECDYDSSSSDDDNETSSSGSSGTDSERPGENERSSFPTTYPYLNSDDEDDSGAEDTGTSNSKDLVLKVKDLDLKLKDGVAYYAWVKAANHQTEVITLDSDDEEEIATNKLGQMQCLRCPPGLGSIYKDKGMFLLHRERHKGTNHFVCPTCSKPFVKISFCFAHEVRIHGMDFPLQNPAIADAVQYRKQKLDWEKQLGEESLKVEDDKKEGKSKEFDDGMDPDFFDDVEPPPIKQTLDSDIIKTPYCTNFTGLVLFPEEGELETDEDDAKFYPDHAVPSTALYPYRGLEPLSMYDCYEIHLRYGRKKKTAANTIARCAMARRRRLIEEGHIAADDMGRFWKPPPIPERISTREKGKRATRNRAKPRVKDLKPSSSTTPATSTSYSVAATIPSAAISTIGGRKRKMPPDFFDNSDFELLAQSEQQILQAGKKRRIAHPKKPAQSHIDISNRTFKAPLISNSRNCLICGFLWASEADLKAHRDAKHPKKTLMELMTLLQEDTRDSAKDTSKVKSKSTKEKASRQYSQSEVLPKRKRTFDDLLNSSNSNSFLSEPLFSPILPVRVRTEQEDFLFSAFGLITTEELSAIQSRPAVPRGKFCVVHMTKLPKDISSNRVKIYTCPDKECEYFNKSRDLIARHVRRKHAATAPVVSVEDRIKSSSSVLKAKMSNARNKYLQLCRTQFVW